MTGDKIITVRELTKKFGEFTAVDNISFDVFRGEIFGFLGANGAGKTTAMRILCGLSEPTSGSGSVNGYDICSQKELIKASIGYMSQKFSLYPDLKVWENIRLFAGIYGMDRHSIRTGTERLLASLEMKQLKDVMVRDLPPGWKQKLAFGVAIIHNPPVVFLDEPTGGVDPETRRMFWEMIYKAALEGTTVFVTTHYMDEAEYCDRVSVMADGKIAGLDTPGSLKLRYGEPDMDGVFRKITANSRKGKI